MSKKLYAKKKKWYDKELKTRDGEVIILMDNNALKMKEGNYNLNMGDKLWIGEKPRLLFKPESDITSLFAEIFSSFFYNKFGLKTIEARPAISVKNKQSYVFSEQGFLSEDFVKNRVKDIDIYLSSFLPNKMEIFHSVEDHRVGIYVMANHLKKNYKDAYEIEIDPEIYKNLTKLVLFDYLTHNTDRHKKNIAYILVKQDDTIKIKLAPIYDNGMSFGLVSQNKDKLLQAIEENDKSGFKNLIDKSRPLHFGIVKKDYMHNESTDYDYERVNKKIKKSLAKEIKNKKWLSNLFDKIVKTSFDDIIEEIKFAIPDFKFNQEDYVLAKYVFEYKKDQLSKELVKNNVKKTDKKNDKEKI